MQSIPVHELPNGQYVYQERSGLYSHQKPNSKVWCERHSTVEDAVRCHSESAEFGAAGES